MKIKLKVFQYLIHKVRDRKRVRKKETDVVYEMNFMYALKF